MSSPHLPQEILDHIIDFLHNEPETLKQCCLVSKLWIPRARKHLFGRVRFTSANDLESWKKTFPDPSNSPSYYTHTLVIGRTRAIMEADSRVGGLVQTFPRIVQLRLGGVGTDNSPNTLGNLEKIPLAPFHNFASTLKSLHVGGIHLPCPQTFSLIRLFPLLEDLSLSGSNKLLGGDHGYDPHEPQTIVPPTSPPFTGTLYLQIFRGVGDMVRYLLDLPKSLHFRRLSLSWDHVGDLRWMTELVARCADTLEYLTLACYPPCAFVLVIGPEP